MRSGAVIPYLLTGALARTPDDVEAWMAALRER